MTVHGNAASPAAYAKGEGGSKTACSSQAAPAMGYMTNGTHDTFTIQNVSDKNSVDLCPRPTTTSMHLLLLHLLELVAPILHAATAHPSRVLRPPAAAVVRTALPVAALPVPDLAVPAARGAAAVPGLLVGFFASLAFRPLDDHQSPPLLQRGLGLFFGRFPYLLVCGCVVLRGVVLRCDVLGWVVFGTRRQAEVLLVALMALLWFRVPCHYNHAHVYNTSGDVMLPPLSAGTKPATNPGRACVSRGNGLDCSGSNGAGPSGGDPKRCVQHHQLLRYLRDTPL